MNYSVLSITFKPAAKSKFAGILAVRTEVDNYYASVSLRSENSGDMHRVVAELFENAVSSRVECDNDNLEIAWHTLEPVALAALLRRLPALFA